MNLEISHLVIGSCLDTVVYAFNRPYSKILVTGCDFFPYKREHISKFIVNPFGFEYKNVGYLYGNKGKNKIETKKMSVLYADLWAHYRTYLAWNNQTFVPCVVRKITKHPNKNRLEIILRNETTIFIDFEKLTIFNDSVEGLEYESLKPEFHYYEIYEAYDFPKKLRYIEDFTFDEYKINIISAIDVEEEVHVYTHSELSEGSKPHESYEFYWALEEYHEDLEIAQVKNKLVKYNQRRLKHDTKTIIRGSSEEPNRKLDAY